MALSLAALVFLPASPADATGVHPTITLTSAGACPDTTAKVTVSGLDSKISYDIRIDGVKQDVVITNGVAVFTVPNKGKQITVSITYKYGNKEVCIKKCLTLKPVDCTPPPPPTPTVSGSATACQTAGGTGVATVTFGNLTSGRSYWLTVQGKDRTSFTPTGSSWSTTVELTPGTYDVTVSSDATSSSVAIPAKTFSVTVKPCPEHTVVLDSCQEPAGKGTATFSFTGLDDSRTYWLSVGAGDRIRVTPTDGKATTSVDREPGSYDVKLVAETGDGDSTVFTDSVTVKPCPEFTAAVQACETIGGTGAAGLTFSHLDDSRTYRLLVPGSPDQEFTSTDGKWTSTVQLAPGTHTITIESAAYGSKPAITPVVLTVTVEPCPQPVTIDLDTECAVDGLDGTVSVAVSGFVAGRDYRVLFTGTAGESTVSKTLTAGSGDEIVDGLLPGQYKVTVADLSAGTDHADELTWSKDIAVVACGVDDSETPPPGGGGDDSGVSDNSVTANDVSALPHTGLDLAGPLALGSGFLGLGLGLLAIHFIRARRRHETA